MSRTQTITFGYETQLSNFNFAIFKGGGGARPLRQLLGPPLIRVYIFSLSVVFTHQTEPLRYQVIILSFGSSSLSPILLSTMYTIIEHNSTRDDLYSPQKLILLQLKNIICHFACFFFLKLTLFFLKLFFFKLILFSFWLEGE